MRDRHGALLGRRGGKLRGGLQAAEEVRLLEDHGRRALRSRPDAVRIRDAAFVGDLDHLESEPGRVRLHDAAHLRVGRLGQDDLVAAGRVLRDEAGVGGDGRAVVAGRIRDVHARQLADRRLVLEDRLQHALAHLRLVRRVCGQELAALEHGVDDRGNVVVVDPRAEEADLVDDVLGGELLEVPLQLRLGERRRHGELAIEADAGGDVSKQLVDRRDADGREHRLAVGVRE